MLNGIHLTLMIGPAVPIPVSQDVLNALTSIEVTNNSAGPSAFQLHFTLNKQSILETLFLLAGGASIPLVRVIAAATVNGITQVLIDGVMTNHQISPGGSAQSPSLTISGEDLTRVMDYIDFSGIPYPAMPPEARVLLVLAKYAVFGVVPMIIPSILIDVPIPVQQIPRQQGKDLAYVRQLADEVGYVFYIEPGPNLGMSVAYWGPEIKVGVPQPALNTDMDVIDETAKYSPIRGALIGLAKAAKSADVVTATGTLDVLRYGNVLKARRLVGVRGAGPAFDGLYYVRSVTHNLKRGEYKQSFTLGRNGLVSTLNSVPA